jgi:tetratricopeptide (TPR) repeat protein
VNQDRPSRGSVKSAWISDYNGFEVGALMANRGADHMRGRLYIGWMLVSGVLTLAGCQPGAMAPPPVNNAATSTNPDADGSKQAQAQSAKAIAPASTEPAAATLNKPIAVPPGVSESQVAALTGSAREKALQPLKQIVADSPVPDYLGDEQEAATQPATAPALDVPLAAQKAYAKARHRLRDGPRSDAIDHLETARRLAPNEPDILALLGRAWLAAGNQVRGARFLEQALQHGPARPELLFLLGRIAQEEQNWAKATALLHQALKLIGQGGDIDPALKPLSHYYLAITLKNRGHIEAALDQFQGYLQTPRTNRRPTQLGQELAFTDQQRGRTWRVVGDLHLRLDQPRQAHEAYRQARQAGVEDELALSRRQIYADLRAGQPRRAISRITEVLNRDQAEPGKAVVDLVTYLKQQGVTVAPLADRLQSMYAEAGRDASTALAIAEVLPAQRGKALLRQHLRQKPVDVSVYTRLLKQYLPEPADGDPSWQLKAAVDLTVQLMAAQPRQAHDYVVPLIQRIQQFESVDAMKQVLAESAEGSARRMSAWLTLRGLTLEAAGQSQRAIQTLKEAGATDDALSLAHVERARMLLNDDQLEAAHNALKVADLSLSDPRTLTLQVTVLQRLGKAGEALALLDRLIDKREEAPVSLLVQKAELLRREGQVKQAIDLLHDALNTHPKAEPLYATLFDLFNAEDAPGNAAQMHQRLLRRMMRQIPQSRIARLQRAQFLIFDREYDRAIGELKKVLSNHPKDWEALARLLLAYRESEQHEAALSLLEKKLQAFPNQRQLLLLARQFYREVEDNKRLRDVTERLLKQQPPGAQRDRILAGIYFNSQRWTKAIEAAKRSLQAEPANPVPSARLLWRARMASDQADQAIAELEALVANRPEHAVDLRYQLSMLHQFLGNDDRAEQLLEKNLQQAPDHTQTQNGLAYFWAERGRNLERALKLVRKALASEPETAAFLDTQGWVLYKLGRFDAAQDSLKQALATASGQHPVIADHLGDTHHRLGNIDQAVDAWNRAQQMLEARGDRPVLDPDMQNLGQRLKAKIESLSQPGPPPLAPVPQRERAAAE